MKQKFPLLGFLLVCLFFSLNILQVHAQAGEWTWISGSNTMNALENYGTQGVPSTLNNPPGLYEACEWTDTSGMFWLYGGSSQSYELANLWMYNPNTNEWTWVKGPGNYFIGATYGTQGVADPANTPGTRGYATSSFTDNYNNLWLFGGVGFGSCNDLWKYDISTNEWTWMKGPNTNGDPGSYGTQGVPDPTNVPASRSECAQSWVDSTGNFWIFGGWSGNGSFNDLWRYDPVTNEWTWMKGSSTVGAIGVYGTKGVPGPNNTPGARNTYTKWNDGHNNLYLFGGDDFTNNNLHNDVWKYSVATNEWTWVSGSKFANNTGNATSTCSPDTLIYPSCRREGRACWTDHCHRFWLYGGSSQGSFYGSQSDLWQFNPINLEWIWVNGPLTILQTGNFGTQGISAATNQPSSRSGNNAWADKSGSLWMFGGCDQNWPGAWNDMWRFVPDTLCTGGICAINNPSQINFIANTTEVCEKYCVDFSDNSINNPASWQWSFAGGSPPTSTLQNPTNICYNLPGSYDVTLITTSAGGNDTLTFSNYITVFATPPFPVITQVGYTLTSSVATSYQWQLNSIAIPGATNQSYTILQSGYYTVVVGDANGCVNSTTLYIVISGVNDVSEGGIFISPNPSNGTFMVEWVNGFMANEVSIDVVNAIGQKVFSSLENMLVNDWKKEIDLSNIARGVYFIQIKTQNNFARKKIVIAD